MGSSRELLEDLGAVFVFILELYKGGYNAKGAYSHLAVSLLFPFEEAEKDGLVVLGSKRLFFP